MSDHLYIHVPFCDGKCHYCGFYSVVAKPAVISLYSGLPACELKFLQETCPNLTQGSLKTVYMGGGTPALLGCDGLKRLTEALAARVSFDAVEEWTVELNPASVTGALLQTLSMIGVNRISIGVQSLDNATLCRVGRRHSAETSCKAIRMVQDAGFDNVGIDLIAGLPGVTETLWTETLERAATFGLKHLSVYALSLEPGTPLALQVAAGLDLPDDASQLDALAQAETVLGQAGFRRYEISNYALPGFECRHNLDIWRGNDYLGLGPAAASRIGHARWTNSEDLAEYIESLTQKQSLPNTRELLSETDDAIERSLFTLRLSEGMDPFSDAERFPALRGVAERWEEQLEGFARQGIVERGGRRWRLTARGREVCDAVLRELV